MCETLWPHHPDFTFVHALLAKTPDVMVASSSWFLNTSPLSVPHYLYANKIPPSPFFVYNARPQIDEARDDSIFFVSNTPGFSLNDPPEKISG